MGKKKQLKIYIGKRPDEELEGMNYYALIETQDKYKCYSTCFIEKVDLKYLAGFIDGVVESATNEGREVYLKNGFLEKYIWAHLTAKNLGVNPLSKDDLTSFLKESNFKGEILQSMIIGRSKK